MSEIPLLDEKCVSFTAVNTETGVLKNKASVITKNLTVSTVLKTVRNSVLIYRNVCKIAHFAAMLFTSQYLLVILAVLINGAYILNPAQMIWAGICAGFITAVSLCFDGENREWHVLRNKIKDHKTPEKFNAAISKYGFICGFLISVFTAAAFFVCVKLTDNAASAQTAAFAAYIISCISITLIYRSRGSFLDLKYFKNKIFLIACALNLCAVLCAVFVTPVRELLGFGEISAMILAVSVLAGICPAVITWIFGIRKRMFFV